MDQYENLEKHRKINTNYKNTRDSNFSDRLSYINAMSSIYSRLFHCKRVTTRRVRSLKICNRELAAVGLRLDCFFGRR